MVLWSLVLGPLRAVLRGPVIPGRAVRTPGPPISNPLSPNFFLEGCADTHSFCDAIHSEDTNLFRFMKKPTTEAAEQPKTDFRFPISNFSFWDSPVVSGPVVPGRAVRTPGA